MPRSDQGEKALFRRLPAVDELLRQPGIAALVARDGQAEVVAAARATLDELRAEIAAGRLDEAKLELALGGLAEAMGRKLRARLSYSLRTVVNATGVVLHTNLGRAPIAESALQHVAEVARGYSNLEFDVAAGERGKRDVHVDRLFRRLFSEIEGEVATVVVNNNAAAVLLALNTLAEGGEVVVSRGELVEIGGSFRIPEVMAKSGATLREVGTTNRTRLADYERAINERTKLLLRVHRSNFQIVGFTEQPALAELAELAHKHHLPLLKDLGSGALLDLRALGIQSEPSVADSLRAGVDVVTYSGDKLLGGPQAGIVSGRKELVGRIRINPMFRALRVDKLTYAALEATLRDYVRQDLDAIPAVRMMRLAAEEVRMRADALRVALVAGNHALRCEIVEAESVVGGGAAPAATLPSFALAVTHATLSADEFAARLRASEPPIIARVEEGRVLLDLRTVFPEQDAVVQAALLSLR
jgi:L-seryl-tRNA(Ser) seleniumtransferase